MNRDTGLFRGRRVDNGAWVEGFLCCGGEFLRHKSYIMPRAYATCVSDFEKKELSIGGFAEVDPDTVGEFTGMYDGTMWEDLSREEQGVWLTNTHGADPAEHWRGKRIFEGDIVEDANGVRYPVVRRMTGFYLKYERPEDCGLSFELLPLCNYWHAHGAIVKVVGSVFCKGN